MNRHVTLLLSLAFAFVLVLLAGVGLYGMSSLKMFDEHVGLITDRLLQKYTLTLKMRRAARERSLNLYRMILMDDPFERDDEWLAFNRNGADFAAAREQLVGMGLEETETVALRMQGDIIRKNVEIQDEIVDLIMDERRDAASRLLTEKALPAQNKVFEHIEQLLAYYANSLMSEREYTENAYRHIVTVGWLAGGIALIAGTLVAFWSVRRIDRAQREYISHEQEQGEIINGMLTGVITVDETGTIVSFNQAATTIFGYKGKEIIGRSVNRLIPEWAHERHERHVEEYFRSADPDQLVREREVQAIKADGTLFPLRIMLSRLPEDRHGKKRVIASCFDITEQKLQEEHLRSSQKMDALGKLTGGIAHDYNNMLGVIQGYSEILKLKAGDDEQLKSYVNEINLAAERGSRLTKKLLSFARRKPIEESVININALLSDDKMMLEKTLTAAIKLDMRLDRELCLVHVDVDDLENAILNICINAQHAMPGGGNLRVETRRIDLAAEEASHRNLPAGQYVLLEIEDDGCGMDEQTRDRIFEPFFSTKGENGTGLGLSQVYGFVKRSGGEINLVSMPGLGTRFEILFPCQDGVETAGPRQNGKHDAISSGQRGSILVVDDEPALRKMIRRLLSGTDYRVFTAGGGEEALEVLEKEHIDLLISDVIMPEMNGFQLAKRVRKDFPGVKVQLMSGYSDDIEIMDIDRELADQLLQKPFHIDDFLQRAQLLLAD